MTAVSYGCEYGDPTEDYAFEISNPEDVYIETENFLESYFNETLENNYQFKAECGQNGDIVVGENLPSNPNRIVSSVIEIPSANGNRTEVILRRW